LEQDIPETDEYEREERTLWKDGDKEGTGKVPRKRPCAFSDDYTPENQEATISKC